MAGKVDAEALRAAAERGDTSAMAWLGSLAYDAGDLKEAKSWYRKAADLGDAESMAMLGLYAQWAGDSKVAKSWYRKAADLDHAFAMYNLGVFAYRAGDAGSAKLWWQKAADLGNSDAMNNLSLFAEDAGDVGSARTRYPMGDALRGLGLAFRNLWGALPLWAQWPLALVSVVAASALGLYALSLLLEILR